MVAPEWWFFGGRHKHFRYCKCRDKLGCHDPLRSVLVVAVCVTLEKMCKMSEDKQQDVNLVLFNSMTNLVGETSFAVQANEE